MDSLEEEQLRGITMKSSAISLYYTNGMLSICPYISTDTVVVLLSCYLVVGHLVIPLEGLPS